MKNPKSITVVLLLSLMVFILEVERKAIETWWPPIHNQGASMVRMHFTDQMDSPSEECTTDKKL